MRHEASCPPLWWEFSVETAVHLYNRTPLKRLQWKTPFELISGKKPDVSYLRVFGCKAWVFISPEARKTKLSPKSEAMTFIGYELNSKSYRFMNNDNSLVISSQATFNELEYPRAKVSKDISTKNIDLPESVNKVPTVDLLPEPQMSSPSNRKLPPSHRQRSETPGDQLPDYDNDEDDIKLEDDPDDDYKPWVVAPETGGVNPAGESSPALEADEEGSPSVEREKSPSPSLEYVSEEPSEHYDRSPSPNPSEMDENVELGEASDVSIENDMLEDFYDLDENPGFPPTNPSDGISMPRDSPKSPDQRMSSPLPSLTRSPSPPKKSVRFMEQPSTKFDAKVPKKESFQRPRSAFDPQQ